MERQSHLKYRTFSWNLRSNIKTCQNSFFKSRFPKHQTQYVKFQTSVSLYWYFERNIANWIVNPTWNIVYFRRLWGQTLRLPKNKTEYVKFQTSVSLYLYFERNVVNWIVNPTWNIVYFRGIWGQTLKLGKMHSSRTHCRKINRNMSSFKHLYLCICTLRGILLNEASIQLEILYIFVDYEVKH